MSQQQDPTSKFLYKILIFTCFFCIGLYTCTDDTISIVGDKFETCEKHDSTTNSICKLNSSKSAGENVINIIITFTNAPQNRRLQVIICIKISYMQLILSKLLMVWHKCTLRASLLRRISLLGHLRKTKLLF